MSNEMLEKIFDKLLDGMPKSWDKVILYIAYFEGSYTMKYYVKEDKGNYIDCYSLKGMSNAKAIKIFMAIDKIIIPEREALGDKKWTVMTLEVNSDGSFKSDFDYKDISTDSLSYEEKWEESRMKHA